MSDNKRPWIFVQGKQAFPFEGDRHDTLLQALEAHRVPIHAECRAGYCGACRTAILAGQVSYSQPPLAFVRDGEILPCCCRPLSNLTLAK